MEELDVDAEWACGTDEISKFLAEEQIDRDCPEKKIRINNCCTKHDECYAEQMGQKNCDDIFCHCLDSASLGNNVCNKEDTPYFCALVRELGAAFYAPDKNSTTNPKENNMHQQKGPANTRSKRYS